jgi:hypothetical protein
VNSRSKFADNWTPPATNAVEMAGITWLGTNVAYDLKLEYVHFTNAAAVQLSWLEPGMPSKTVIGADRFAWLSAGATGISVDSCGKLWAGCFDYSCAVRVDPEAGPLAVTADGQTNHVGLVDMVVDLGDGSWHPAPYNQPATPYNYSDMTGFNNQVVNPSGQPLKGYWTVINDSGIAGQWWQRLSWSNNLPIAGCSMEVYVRASDDRAALPNIGFVTAGNNASLKGVKGRYLEVRVALMRDDPSKQPVLYDLTLHGSSSGFAGEFMDVLWEPSETETAWFFTDLTGAGPLTYQWYVMPPWTSHWALATNAAGPELLMTNVDLWDDWTLVSLTVSNVTGEALTLGPRVLRVWPLPINIPTIGAASRYPATLNVRGEPTNLWYVEVTLMNLTHDYPADLDILLVSPTDHKIMLMSDAGGSTPVTNGTLVFLPQWKGYDYPPCQGSIQSGQTTYYSPYNCDGGDNDSMPSPAPPAPYPVPDLNELYGTNPNGVWKLYIRDDRQGQGGIVYGSWWLKFYYQ